MNTYSHLINFAQFRKDNYSEISTYILAEYMSDCIWCKHTQNTKEINPSEWVEENIDLSVDFEDDLERENAEYQLSNNLSELFFEARELPAYKQLEQRLKTHSEVIEDVDFEIRDTFLLVKTTEREKNDDKRGS